MCNGYIHEIYFIFLFMFYLKLILECDLLKSFTMAWRLVSFIGQNAYVINVSTEKNNLILVDTVEHDMISSKIVQKDV